MTDLTPAELMDDDRSLFGEDFLEDDMTDLAKALAEVKSGIAYDDILEIILNGVMSGELIPLAEVHALQAERDAWREGSRVQALALKAAEQLATERLNHIVAAEAELAATQAKLARVVDAAEALGAMPEGYCFCSQNRIGDESKTHEPECRDFRLLLQKIKG